MTVEASPAHAAGPPRERVMPDAGTAFVLFCLLLAIYNANGREIPSYDSQPTKFAARELLVRGTLGLNHVVGAEPLLRERPAFVLARDGRYRSAYSPVPAIAAAAVAWPVWSIGAIDVRGSKGAQTIAVLGASVQTAAAVVLAFFTLRRRLSRSAAFMAAAVLGLGTGYWHTVSQTLWQHETAILGLALAVYALTANSSSRAMLVVAGAGLALAVTSRLQLAPAALVLLAGTAYTAGWRRAMIPASIAAAGVAVLLACYMRWFGSPLGALPLLEALHPAVHATTATFDPFAGGFVGLLLSPNRGLLIFSPIVAVAALAIGQPARVRSTPILAWCALAALAQYMAYACYGIWWAGHTYGPRYMLDVLPLLVPLAGAALPSIRRSSPLTTAASAAALWSIVVAGTGAFVYPDELWNVTPRDVDRHHERLWDWSDMQIVRCWRTGSNSRNFNLFSEP